MSKAQQHYSEYIKQGVFVIIVLAVALFGIKGCRKFQQKRDVTATLTSYASESAAYEQFYKESAEANLFKAMHQIHLGTQLGLTPEEILEKVMLPDKGFLASEKELEISIRKILIRDALLSNYDNCHKLAIFEIPLNLDALAKGQRPTISKGPAANEEVVIQAIISSEILPGVDKLLPNMIISPPENKKSTAKETYFERARAKQLAEALSNANLIENSAYKKIVDAYEQLDKPLEKAAEETKK